LKIFLELANTNDTTAPVRAVVTPQQPWANNVASFHVPNMSSTWRKTENVALVTKETGHSPKHNVLKQLLQQQLRRTVKHPNDSRIVLVALCIM
jgi:hypothetical protein